MSRFNCSFCNCPVAAFKHHVTSCFQNERATGYGVALLTALFGASPCGAAPLRALAADADVANGTASSLSPSPSPSSSDPKKQKVG